MNSRSDQSLEELQRADIEEPDIRIIIHIIHSVKERFERFVILSSYTDIVVLALTHWQSFKAERLKVSLSFFLFNFLSDLR